MYAFLNKFHSLYIFHESNNKTELEHPFKNLFLAHFMKLDPLTCDSVFPTANRRARCLPVMWL